MRGVAFARNRILRISAWSQRAPKFHDACSKTTGRISCPLANSRSTGIAPFYRVPMPMWRRYGRLRSSKSNGKRISLLDGVRPTIVPQAIVTFEPLVKTSPGPSPQRTQQTLLILGFLRPSAGHLGPKAFDRSNLEFARQSGSKLLGGRGFCHRQAPSCSCLENGRPLTSGLGQSSMFFPAHPRCMVSRRIRRPGNPPNTPFGR